MPSLAFRAGVRGATRLSEPKLPADQAAKTVSNFGMSRHGTLRPVGGLM